MYIFKKNPIYEISISMNNILMDPNTLWQNTLIKFVISHNGITLIKYLICLPTYSGKCLVHKTCDL